MRVFFRQSRQNRFIIVTILAVAMVLTIVALAFSSAPERQNNVNSLGMGQCRPCHLNIEKAKVDGVKFSHKAHFEKGVNCSGCHMEFPHFRDRTERVTMAACFSCHGVTHGNKRLASGDCLSCHEKNFNLRPASHGGTAKKTPRKRPTMSASPTASEWEKSGHIAPAKKDIANCYMCHKCQYCFDCHKAENVTQSDIYDKAKDVVREEAKGTWKNEPNTFPQNILDLIQGGEPVRASFCFPCHSSKSMMSAKVTGVIYNHEAHFKKEIRCLSCHQLFPHVDDKTNYIDEEVCHYCHGVQHGTKVIAPRKCGLCHPPGFKLTHDKLPIELSENWKTRHQEVFQGGKINCYRCHTNSDCINCHLKKNVLPNTHQMSNWALRHGERPSKELKTCEICHEQEWCTSCHKTPMPHPPLWFRDHKAPPPRERDCYICHKQSMCQDCHHESGLKLDRKVCEDCHKTLESETYLTPSLKFNHEPHFERKIECTQCHRGNDPGKKETFMMESCYSAKCHGYGAKAKASGTCMFCHPTQFDLVPKDHKADRWNTKIHSRTALRNKKPCELCHTEEFCVNCHGAPMPHPEDFKEKHGKWGRMNSNSCLRCHKNLANCKTCHHKGWKPGNDWTKQHPPIVKENGASECFKCHSPVECAQCHLKNNKLGF